MKSREILQRHKREIKILGATVVTAIALGSFVRVGEITQDRNQINTDPNLSLPEYRAKMDHLSNDFTLYGSLWFFSGAGSVALIIVALDDIIKQKQPKNS